MRRALIVLLALLSYSSPLPAEAAVVYPVQFIAVAGVSTDTSTPTPISAPTETATATSAPTNTPTNTSTAPTTTAPVLTSTPVPLVDGIRLENFSPPAEEMIRNSFARLKNCSPSLYSYVLNNVSVLYSTRVTNTAAGSGWVNIAESLIFYYPPDLQPIAVMAILTHEARHNEQYHLGLSFSELDANRFFPQLIRDCAQGLDVTPLYSAR